MQDNRTDRERKEARLQTLAENYFDAFSKKSIGRLNLMFAENVVLRDWEHHVQGKEAVLELNKIMFDDVDWIKAKPQNIVCFTPGASTISCDVVVAELEVYAGALGDKDVQPILVTDIIEFDSEGKIIALRAYKGN
mgnify:CR=1 FL=1